MSELESPEEARRETDSRYRLASRAVFEAIWDWNLRTGITSWSEGLRAVFGYTPGEMGSGAHWWSERLHPEDRERVVEAYERALEGGAQEWTDEYRFRRKDGTYCWVITDTRFGPAPQLRGDGVISGAATIVHGTERPFGALCAYSRQRREFTSSKQDEDLVRSYSLGANAYVRKPVGFSEFAEAVRTLGLFWLVLNEPAPPGRTGA